jgi:hypothetical protein
MNAADESRVRRFFTDRLVPAAQALRARGVQFFPLAADPAASSWYVPPPPESEDFVALDESRYADLMRDMWQAQGLPELAGLADPLMELSTRLELQAEQTPDISPYVYVMY